MKKKLSAYRKFQITVRYRFSLDPIYLCGLIWVHLSSLGLESFWFRGQLLQSLRIINVVLSKVDFCTITFGSFYS